MDDDAGERLELARRIQEEEKSYGKIRQSCWKKREERATSRKARNVALRQGRKRRTRDEPQAGHRHRPFRSPQKGRQGSRKTIELDLRAVEAGATSRASRPRFISRAGSPASGYFVFFASLTSSLTRIETTEYSRSFWSPSRSSTNILSLRRRYPTESPTGRSRGCFVSVGRMR
jgi:hypothetical protein